MSGGSGVGVLVEVAPVELCAGRRRLDAELTKTRVGGAEEHEPAEARIEHEVAGVAQRPLHHLLGHRRRRVEGAERLLARGEGEGRRNHGLGTLCSQAAESVNTPIDRSPAIAGSLVAEPYGRRRRALNRSISVKSSLDGVNRPGFLGGPSS